MDNRLFSGDQSLNVQVGEEGDTEWQDMLVDSNDTQDDILANSNELSFRKKIFEEKRRFNLFKFTFARQIGIN